MEPSTVSAYMAWNRATTSATNRLSPVAVPSATAAARFRPRFRIVSIMPGMEIGAPDRTDSSNGTGPPPKTLPVANSNPASRARISRVSPSGSRRLFR
jgi:hypothetical protein